MRFTYPVKTALRRTWGGPVIEIGTYFHLINKDNSNLKIEFYVTTRELTGSCQPLHVGKHTVFPDCGLTGETLLDEVRVHQGFRTSLEERFRAKLQPARCGYESDFCV
jgi:hypothetical protein